MGAYILLIIFFGGIGLMSFGDWVIDKIIHRD